MNWLFHAVLVTLTMFPSAGATQSLQSGVSSYAAGDFQAAFRELKPLAEQGNAFAQINLGVMYENGEGVPQDYVEAVRWYTLAAKQGNAWVRFNLGVLHENGEGVPQDYVEAARWYRLAAEKNHPSAQARLGLMYQNGRGGLQDNQTAHMWYNIAFVNGHEDAEKWRDELAIDMTFASIKKAQQRALVCITSDYLICD